MSPRLVLLLLAACVAVGAVAFWGLSRDDLDEARGVERAADREQPGEPLPAAAVHPRRDASLAGRLPTESPPARPPETGEGRLPPDQVAGRIVDEAGAPAAGVTVWIARTGHRLAASATTGADGEFLFRGLDAEDHLLTVVLEGHASTRWLVTPGSAPFQVQVEKERPLAGTVVERGTSLPVAAIRLTARSALAPEYVVASTTTAEDGTFAFPALAPGAYLIGTGAAPYAAASAADEFLRARFGPFAAGTTDVRMEIERGLAISGEMRDGAGAPWRGRIHVKVMPRTLDGDAMYANQRTVTFEGTETFRLAGLPGGAYDLTFDPAPEPGEESSDISTVTLERIAAGTEGVVVELRRGRPITGHLEDDEGQRVPRPNGGILWVGPPGTPAGAPGSHSVAVQEDGTFETLPLDSGRAYDLQALAFPGYREGRLEGVHPGDEDVVLVLPRAAAITGRVVDEEGRPLSAGIAVMAQASNAPREERFRPGTGAYSYTTTSEGGLFRLEGLGDYEFTVDAGGGPSGYVTQAPVHGVKAGTSDVVLRVRRGVPFRGRLVDQAGNPVQAAWLWARSASPGSLGSNRTTVDAGGRFDFAGVPEGEITLRAQIAGEHVMLGTYRAPSEDAVVTVPD